jgi:predicted nucleotidyltransferase component of viral defense system
MQDLIQQERLEMEVLNRLQSGRLLEPLGFVGGTMLRLCHGLNRYSVDLDFWFTRDADYHSFYEKCREYLAAGYRLKDAANKFHTILFELSAPGYPRSLKIEIRKEKKKYRFTDVIAYSRHSDLQVLVRALSLEDMLTEKLKALTGRKEIRDAFDLEFILRRGVALKAEPKILRAAARVVTSFPERDYRVKLGSLLEAQDRRYYRENNFKYLTAMIQEKLKSQMPGPE